MAQVGGSGDRVEPNLIPLLDLVLQLVMFFIMVANFAVQEVTGDVVLPLSSAAKGTGPKDTDVIYLNLNHEGKVIVPGRDDLLVTVSEIKYYLKQLADEQRNIQARAGDKSGVLNTVVIIRAHRDADFKPVYVVLREAKQAGFNKWQLRAIVKNQPS
jgi:biopolymer transport protein ExbD